MVQKQEIYVGKVSIYRRGLNKLKRGVGIKQDPLSKVEKVAGFTTDTATTRPAARPAPTAADVAAPREALAEYTTAVIPALSMARLEVPELQGRIPAGHEPPAERTLEQDKAESSAVVARAKHKASLEAILTSLPVEVRDASIQRINDKYRSLNEHSIAVQRNLIKEKGRAQREIAGLQDRVDNPPAESTAAEIAEDREKIESLESELAKLDDTARTELAEIERQAREFDIEEDAQRERERLAAVTKLRDERLPSTLIRCHDLVEEEKKAIHGKSNDLPFEDPDLLIQPKEITAKELQRLKRHDVSLFPKTKNHDVPVLSNQKKDEPLAKGKTATFAIPILRGNQKVYVKFLPDPDDITRGKIVSNGDSKLTEDIEYDFIRKQWTTPHQANQTISDTNLDMTADLAAFAARTDVKDIKNHDVRAIISAHIADVQFKNAEFMGGNITETEFTSFLTEKRIKILELAKSEHERRKDRRDNNIRFAIQTALACVAGAFVGVRVFGGRPA